MSNKREILLALLGAAFFELLWKNFAKSAFVQDILIAPLVVFLVILLLLLDKKNRFSF